MATRKLLVRAAGQNSQLRDSDAIAAYTMAENLTFGPKLDIQSQATTDLMSVNSNNVEIQGAATITSFGAGTPGLMKYVTFGTSGVTLKQLDGTLDLPGQADIVANQYDWLLAHCVANNNWRIRVYNRRNGTALVSSGGGTGDFKKNGSVQMTGGLDQAPPVTWGTLTNNTLDWDVIPSNTAVAPASLDVIRLMVGARDGARRLLKLGTGQVLQHTDNVFELPGYASITSVVGDSAEFIRRSSTRWQCVWYQRADGTALVSSGGSGPANTDALPEGTTNLYFTNARARSATRFTWDQSTAMAVWTIPHNTNGYPSVTVVDTLGNVVTPDISYVDANTVQITHGAAYAGKAYIN
jgi:hypothetical protein